MISIVMGSKNDDRVMKAASAYLKRQGLEVESFVVSAHRTPQWLFSYARGASRRGVRVIIAGAGGAAHLPGMIAALTHVPVIGVPIRSRDFAGLDSLLSIAQMPRGIVVGTVPIDGARAAALAAEKILRLAR